MTGASSMTVAILLITLVSYVVVSRIPVLRRYRRIVFVTGILIFLACVYVDREAVRDSFLDGWRAGVARR